MLKPHARVEGCNLNERSLGPYVQTNKEACVPSKDFDQPVGIYCTLAWRWINWASEWQKPVFEASDKGRLKPVSSATETS